MIATRMTIPDVVLLQPKVFGDERGFFYESFNQQRFEDAIARSVTFVQDNHSKSTRGVLRGLHYQVQQPQGKLVRSEEHTSELQSLMRISYAVFCLKKKKITQQNTHKILNK